MTYTKPTDPHNCKVHKELRTLYCTLCISDESVADKASPHKPFSSVNSLTGIIARHFKSTEVVRRMYQLTLSCSNPEYYSEVLTFIAFLLALSLEELEELFS